MPTFEYQFPAPVLTKTDFVKRYAAGEFGNASPTWDSVAHMEEDFENSYPLLNDPTQLWHIRNRVRGGDTWYNVEGVDLPDKWAEVTQTHGSDSLYISAMAPTEKTILQGEVMRTPTGLYLHYTSVRKPMRDALAESAHDVMGLEAHGILAVHLDVPSVVWMNHLLNSYPDHVVEFSTYSKKWGTVPGYNTVFWEVRKY